MSTRWSLSCGLLALFMAGTAWARGPAMAGAKKYDGGLYVGGSVGSAQINLSDDIADVDFDSDNLGYKIFAGYSGPISPRFNLGAEGSYVDFGRFSSPSSLTQDLETKAWDLFGVGTVRFGAIGLFGKVGTAWWSGEIDGLDDILGGIGDHMVYGAGVQFQADRLVIRAEYERFDADVANVDFISVGASLLF